VTWYEPVYQAHLASYSPLIIKEPNTNKDYEPYTVHSTTPGDTITSTGYYYILLAFGLCTSYVI
jgi:hypothetical protein